MINTLWLGKEKILTDEDCAEYSPPHALENGAIFLGPASFCPAAKVQTQARARSCTVPKAAETEAVAGVSAAAMAEAVAEAVVGRRPRPRRWAGAEVGAVCVSGLGYRAVVRGSK